MADIDINSVPYDAPLSFPEPPRAWIRQQTRKGAESSFLTAPNTDLSGKWVIITGSNSGIGREAALQFAAWGANIVLACRQLPPGSLEPHPQSIVDECLVKARLSGHRDNVFEWWEINMAELASVESFANRWLQTARPLDILCNNAGMGSSPGGQDIFLTKDGFEIIHQVNFLSHVLLTLTLLPSIAAASAPRIVCTTSCFHYPGKFPLSNFNGESGLTGDSGVQLYMNNKLWFQIWLTELQHRLLEHEKFRHITVNGVHPGYVNSGIWTLSKKSWFPWKQYLVYFLAWMKAIDSQQGSLAIINAATSTEAGPDPKTQGVGAEGGKGGGRYFNRIWEEEAMPHTRDRDARLRVWRKVNDALKLQDKASLDTLGVFSTD